MNGIDKKVYIGGAGLVLVVLGISGFLYVEKHLAAEQALLTEANMLCNKWADTLDSETDDSGVYIRRTEVPDKDPWGNEFVITYYRGGAVESVEVRSSGPDGVYSTDDIVKRRKSANLAGVGAGIRDNVEETAEGTSRGVVRGMLDAWKERKEKKDKP